MNEEEAIEFIKGPVTELEKQNIGKIYDEAKKSLNNDFDKLGRIILKDGKAEYNFRESYNRYVYIIDNIDDFYDTTPAYVIDMEFSISELIVHRAMVGPVREDGDDEILGHVIIFLDKENTPVIIKID